MTTRDGLIPREQAERTILAAPPAELLRMAAVASGPQHEGRADLDLRTGRLVLGHSEVGTAGRVVLCRVPAGTVDFPEEDPDDEVLDEDDLDLLGAEIYAMEHPPGVSAEEVLAGAREALDEAYGGGAPA